MARRRDQVVALILAVVFFATSAGVSVLVIVQFFQENKEAEIVNQAQDNTNLLQGTTLADFTPIDKADELQTIDLEPGDGPEVKLGDTVTVDYTGAVASTGQIFQSSLDSGNKFTTALVDGAVIDGWVEGIPGMKVGGKRRIIIPTAKAYGENPPEGIPVNADLVFDVTLHSVGQ